MSTHGNRESVRSGAWVTYDHRGAITTAGTVTEYPATDVQAVTYVIAGAEPLKDASRSVFLLDDGATVAPTYIAGYRQDSTELYVQPFPLNGGTRPDNGRPVDFTSWALSPRRAYHLKVTWSE